jgi:hypothetical protein
MVATLIINTGIGSFARGSRITVVTVTCPAKVPILAFSIFSTRIHISRTIINRNVTVRTRETTTITVAFIAQAFRVSTFHPVFKTPPPPIVPPLIILFPFLKPFRIPPPIR